jgi:trans-aconitate methyltransferase
MPNDEAEQDRLDLHHHIFRLCLDGNLLAGPVPNDVKRVLDIGTGTGIWAIDFADEHPSATIIGTDLSPIQPSWLPPNCSFYVEDVESEWLYTPEEAFDLIHSRGMVGSISSWTSYYEKILQNLRPGGRCEVQEYECWIHAADDPRMVRSPCTSRWQILCDVSYPILT